jgi:hypothetical protein
VIARAQWIGYQERPAQAPVAQLDRALPSEGRGHRFESYRVRHLYNKIRILLHMLRLDMHAIRAGKHGGSNRASFIACP